MTDQSPEQRASTMASIFLRKGGEGQFTKLFRNVVDREAAALRSNLSIGSSEIPVLGAVFDAESWFLLTTQRFVVRSQNQHSIIALSDIVDVNVDPNLIARSGKTLQDWNQLRIQICDGRWEAFQLEAGQPLIGIWNVLLHITARNRGSPK